MPTVIPYIPRNITVHLGAPNSDAPNVTVPFVDYVKNVASSEIYPTWDDAALRANIYAIVSFALNRVYTEFYRSRGYPFDITSSTAIDQYFVNGRSYFENVSRLVDELYNDYLRRPGFVEPLAAKFSQRHHRQVRRAEPMGQSRTCPAGTQQRRDPAALLRLFRNR